MATPGGRIAPDGRPAQAPGIGANAKRHDLEQPKTPGLHGSDLQQGDVQAMEQGQRIAPIKENPVAVGVSGSMRGPARPGPNPPSPQGAMATPDPIEFAKKKLKGTLARSEDTNVDQVDVRPWVPLLRQLASNPTSSGLLTAAYVQRLSELAANPVQGGRAIYVNQRELDRNVERFLNDNQR